MTDTPTSDAEGPVVEERTDRRGWRAAAAAVLLTHAGLLAYSIPQQSPTYDEPAHLLAGLWYLRTGVYQGDPGNPPLVGTIAALFVLPTDWKDAGDAEEFVDENGSEIFRIIAYGRFALVSFSVLAGFVCWRWSRELYGERAGLFSLILWAFCPWTLWWGQQLTGDMTCAATGVLAFYLFWKWLNSPTVDRAFFAGLGLGLAELSKFLWALAWVLWPVLWICRRLMKPRSEPRPRFFREAVQFGVIVFLSVYVLNLGYCFYGSFEPLGTYRFESRTMQALVGRTPEQPGDEPDRATWRDRIPVPLPSEYVNGVDAIGGVRENPYRATYFRGERRKGGWPWYYVYGLLVKLPLGYWVVIGTAGVLTVVRKRHRDGWRDELLLVAPIVTVLWFVTWASSVQFLRYVLPIAPFLFIWCGKVAADVEERRRLIETIATGAACVGLTWGIVSSLWVYPHSGSYFNELAGGPENGYRHLSSSSFDWGQDLLYLKRWADEHPEARPLYVAYSGRVDPAVAGIEYEQVPVFELPPGWYAVSVSLTQGGGRIPNRGMLPKRLQAFFAGRRPVGRAGYSILIYHLDSAVGLPVAVD